ncbi:MAG: RluA family pseudouridine synthase [Alphaproteobacteria bacterium]
MTGADELSVVIAAEASGLRLDRALAEALAGAPDAPSRSRIQALIREGAVTGPDGVATDPAQRVQSGQTFAIILPHPQDSTVAAQAIALDILFEDEDLIVIDKPTGMVVHPGPGTPDGTLVNALLAHCDGRLSGIGGVRRPGIVHRLDKDTSGVMVAAKNDMAHRALAAQFEDRSIERAYLAVAWGLPMPTEGEIAGNIGRDPRDRKRMAVVAAPRGKPALTRYRLLRPLGRPRTGGAVASLLECRLATGRTHQIRVHLAHAGHPLIGDPVYGRLSPARRRQLAALGAETAQLAADFGRQALHARLLGFAHPRDGAAMRFERPMPPDMQALIAALETEQERV